MNIDLSNFEEGEELAFRFDILLGTGYVPHEKIVTILTEVYIYASKLETEPTGKFVTEIGFTLANFDEVVSIVKRQPVLEPQTLSRLIDLAYSTTRGMLSARFSGTKLEGAILPVVAPEDLTAFYHAQVEE